MLASSRFTRTTQRRKHKHKRMEILLCLCICLRRCVVRVNRDDASISTSASTRRLCLRRTGLHVGFLCLCLCLCLCLRRTCKPGFNEQCISYKAETNKQTNEYYTYSSQNKENQKSAKTCLFRNPLILI